MKTIQTTLSRELQYIELVPFADLHIGDTLCDIELIKNKIEYVKNNEEVYCLLNGDIINNSTKTSVGDVYADKMTPMEQIKKAIELFKPIKDKIICVTNGNHEARTWKADGVDLMNLFAMELGIEDRYASESAVIFVRFGKNTNNGKDKNGKPKMACYVLFVTHGSGGGRKEGSKVNRLAEMASIIDADIYIHSHTHLPIIMKQKFLRVDVRTSTVASVTKLFVNTSSMLNYGGYGEALEFKPSSKDNPHIFLNGMKKDFLARL